MQSVQFENTVKIDFRFLVLLLLGFYRLVSPLFIAATIMSIHRFSYGIDFYSIVACVALFTMVIGTILTYRIVWLQKRLFQFGLTLNVWTCLVAAMGILVGGGFTERALDVALLVTLISKEVPNHIKINHSASIIYGTSFDYEVSERLIPDLIDHHVPLECIRLHLIAVLVFKSIVAEVSSLNLYIEDHAITRITLQGRRPRVYTNVTPSTITVDQPVHFSLK
jgi:hypothetical protein